MKSSFDAAFQNGGPGNHNLNARAKRIPDAAHFELDSVGGTSASSNNGEFKGFDAGMIVASWGLPVFGRNEIFPEKEKMVQSRPQKGEETKRQDGSFNVLRADSHRSFLDEGQIFTHYEVGKEDASTDSPKNSHASISAASSHEGSSLTRNNNSYSDIEEGMLSFGPAATIPTAEWNEADPDVMTNKQHSFIQQNEKGDIEECIDVTSAPSPIQLEDTKQRSWVLVGIVCLMIIFLIGGGVAATLVFLSNKSAPTPSETISPSGPTSLSQPQLLPTHSPKGEPDADATESLVQLLEATGGAIALEDPDSPQSKALDWMLDNVFLDGYSDDQIRQRFVMASLYYSTNGESWIKQSKWLSEADECMWYTSETESDICKGVMLIELDLDTNNLGGTLPWTDLAMLSNQLQILDVFGNEISGFLNSQIGLLTSLMSLDLATNQFSGSLPVELGLLQELRYMNMDSNFFTGRIPTQLAALTAIETISLSNNLLTGTIPTELGQLSGLRHLSLQNTFLSGTMPQQICDLDLVSLEVTCELVQCSCCSSCTGDSGGGGSGGNAIVDLIIAKSLDNGESLQDPQSPQSAALRWLQRPINDSFSDDQLVQRYALATLYYATGGDTGRWTASSLWLTALNECQWFTTSDSSTICSGPSNSYLELDLRSNGLTGTLPEEIAMLTDLTTLRLSENGITGSLPSSLSLLSRLEYLDLAANRLTEEVAPSDNVFVAGNVNGGTLFSQLGDMQALTHLSLFQNLFETTIPTTIGLLSGNLRILDLGSNLLFGTLPNEVGLLTNLVGLSVLDNSLSGSLPEQLSNLFNLEMLYVDGNDFGPPVPLGVCRLVTLRDFWSDCEEVECVCCTTCCSDGFGCVAA
ncbi:RHS repeat-associated core domain containing protein [Nitzschia inconspicua]|uniref:RHS repeat-associated core domain containing protein n=1 Tax=Nitzschia inconspicua TaxID=303405 RepID=A0A9K3KL26_9STRA|nr:RHS repeat-associated core domain containing protein [Nitzschia inconspicua]